MEDRTHGVDDGVSDAKAGRAGGTAPDDLRDARVGTAETVVPPALARLGPASWWRLGLVALLGVMVVILALGGGFWQAEPVDVPR